MPVFKTGAFNHSATRPIWGLQGYAMQALRLFLCRFKPFLPINKEILSAVHLALRLYTPCY